MDPGICLADSIFFNSLLYAADFLVNQESEVNIRKDIVGSSEVNIHKKTAR